MNEKRFFAFFARRHKLANLFVIAVLLLGTVTLVRMKRDTFPNVDLGMVMITTRYPAASPEDVELNVTNPIEDELIGIPDIDQIESYSMEGLSIIDVRIDVDAPDLDDVKADIREAVTRVTDLPPEVTEAPQITEIENEIIPVIEVGLAGDLPYRQLWEAARRFKDRLENLDEVSRVDEIYFLDPEVRIEASPDALSRFQVALGEIVGAVRERNMRAAGGSFESYADARGIVVPGQYAEPGDVAGTVIRSVFNGPSLLVRELAQVSVGFEEPRLIAHIDGRTAIAFQVLKKETADIIRTVDRIRQLAEEEEPALTAGTDILFTNDLSYYIRQRFNVVLTNGGIGFLLVLAILYVFLNFRAAFWVALSIPVALLGVVFFMPLFDSYINIISLMAMLLVLGIIVDDGVIVSENIIRMREEGLEPCDAAAAGIADIFRPVSVNLMTTTLAFLPLLFMPGIVGEFVREIPLVIILALGMSLLEVVVSLPAHLAPGLRKVSTGHSSDRQWFLWVRRRFERILRAVLHHRYLAVLTAVALFAATIAYALMFMRFELFPDTAANNFVVYLETVPGSSLRKTEDLTKRVERFIGELPQEELESYATVIGSHGELEPGENERWAYIQVNLTPYDMRTRTAAEIVDRLRQQTEGMEGFREMLYQVEAGGPPVGAPVTIRIVGGGGTRELRRRLTDRVVEFLGSMEGVTDINRNDITDKVQLHILPDYPEMANLGVSVAALGRTIRTAYDGEIASSMQYDGEDVDFRVLLTEEARKGTEDLADLLVPNDRGRLIRIGDIARWTDVEVPSTYYHFNGEPTTTVTAEVVEGTVTPVQVTERVLQRFDLARDWPGLRFVIGGEAQETQESFNSLFIAFSVAVVGIYFLLILLFDSVTQPLIVITAIPFGIVAVIVAFALHALPLGFLAMMGLVGLSGVVVNDSLVMVDHINRLSEKNPETPVGETVLRGAGDRLRAVSMTTLTTVAGVLPLAYGIGGSDPFVAPMALALGYGILLATPLTLLLMPCFYLIRFDIVRVLERYKSRRERRKKKKTP